MSDLSVSRSRTGRPSAATRSAAEPRPSQSRLVINGIRLLVVLVVLVLWQLSVSRHWVSELLLPAPREVLSAMKGGLISGEWWPHIGVTVLETLLGFLVGLVLAAVLGTVFAFIPVLRRALYPFVLASQTFPKIAVAPLLIVALGYGLGPKVAIAALLAFFPILVATMAGLTEIDPDEHNLMRSIQAGTWHEMRYLRIPNAMSYVFPAMDVAIVFSLLGAIVAEFLGASAGMGYLIQQRSAYGDIPTIFGALFVMVAIGLSFKGLLALLHRMLPTSIVPK